MLNEEQEKKLEQVAKWFDCDSYDYKFLNFDKIENKFSNRPDLHAFIMLDRLSPIPKYPSEDLISNSEHDEYYLSVSQEVIANLTKDQVIELLRCGIYYNSEFNCLYAMT